MYAQAMFSVMQLPCRFLYEFCRTQLANANRARKDAAIVLIWICCDTKPLFILSWFRKIALISRSKWPEIATGCGEKATNIALVIATFSVMKKYYSEFFNLKECDLFFSKCSFMISYQLLLFIIIITCTYNSVSPRTERKRNYVSQEYMSVHA